MPVKITKSGGGYKVSTPHGIKAKHTTKAKAEAQQRLLNVVEHNPNFNPRNRHNPGHVPGHMPFDSVADMRGFHPQTMEEFRRMMGG